MSLGASRTRIGIASLAELSSRYLPHTGRHTGMNPATSLAARARQTAAAVARWTALAMGLSLVIKLALAGG